ncbi:salicylic acid-binding protein 2-like [Tasmannia lanceolata]|uniref:salicylic acid-binding protein 2-like n=1 Tax=Tasmannia lanceolata TaxID=3420 RepID=UPI0040641C75
MSTWHFVLVHGAGHGSWEWYKVATLLQDANHKVSFVNLEASGINTIQFKDVMSFEEYTKPLMEFMRGLKQEKVILVGHSFGGFSIAKAMDKFPENVSLGVFINAYMPDATHPPGYVLDKANEGGADYGDSTIIPQLIPSGQTGILFGPKFLKTMLYQLSPEQDYTLARTLIRMTSFFQKDLENEQPYSAYGAVKRAFIRGKEDKCLVENFQIWQIDNFPPKEVIVLENTDHEAMFSNPQGVYKALLEFAKKYA